MNHNSYVTSVVTTNHLEMKNISSNDNNHQNNDKTSDSIEDNNCLMNGINDNQNCFKTTNSKSSDISMDSMFQKKCQTKSDSHLSKSEAIVGNNCDNSSRNKLFIDKTMNQTNSDYSQHINSNYSKYDDFYTSDTIDDNHRLMANRRDGPITGAVPCVPTTSSAPSKQPYHKNEEVFRRRASDISQELNKRFGQQKLMNGRHQTSLREGSQPTVRFSNNATIYNYQCQRFGHSMESLDSETNGYNPNQNAYNRSAYDYPTAVQNDVFRSGNTSNRSQVGFSYTMRPARGSAKQYRRSGGSLAALLAIDARDSPDEGLGDEREYETDILD